MAARPSTTILLLTRQMIVRADFTSSNTLAGLWRRPRPDVHDWPMLVDAALALGPAARTRVFVLCADLWTQTVSLGKSAGGISEAELASALNFEAEALSGHSALESVVSVRTLPAEDDGHWIVQARLADIEHAADIICGAGGQFVGVLHPAGVPVSLDKRETRWARLEFWPDAVVLVRGAWRGPTSVHVLNADPQLGRWRGEWEQWRHGMGDADALHGIVAPGMNLPAPLPETLSLDDEAHLSRWLTAWAGHLAAKKPDVPLLRPAVKPISTTARVAMSAALAVVVIAACVGCQLWLDGRVADARMKAKGFAEPAKRFADNQKSMQALETKRQDLHVQTAHFEQSVKVLKAQRHRLGRLLTCLDECRVSEDLHVDRITSDGGEPRLVGVCLQPELADQFANRLGKALIESGWEVQAPKKQALKLADDGGPWSFEIALRGSSQFTLEIPEAKKK